MKKKKLMSPEALKKLFPQGNASAVEGQEVVVEQIDTGLPVEGEEVVETESSETVVETVVETAEETDVALAQLVQDEFDDYKADTDQKVTDLETQNAALVAELAEKVTPLHAIVVGMVSGMRVALSLPDVDMSEYPVADLVKAYEASAKDMESFPVGSVIPEDVEVHEEKVAPDSLAASGVKALGF